MSVVVHPYKVNHVFAVLDDNGFTAPGGPRVSGFIMHDTRHVSQWHWDFTGLDLIEQTRSLTGLTQYWSQFVDHEQALLIRRTLTLRHDGFDDVLSLRNERFEAITYAPRLTCDADFIDTFEQRGRVRGIPRHPVAPGIQRLEHAHLLRVEKDALLVIEREVGRLGPELLLVLLQCLVVVGARLPVLLESVERGDEPVELLLASHACTSAARAGPTQS